MANSYDPTQSEFANIQLVGELAARMMDDVDQNFRHVTRLAWPKSLVDITQDLVDEHILEAQYLPPVWSEFVTVRKRPTVWDFASQMADTQSGHIVFASDDCFVVGDSDGIFALMTFSPVPVGSEMLYQLAFHLFDLGQNTLVLTSIFHELSNTYDIASFPDADLIDEHKVSPTGDNLLAYLKDPRRQRPVFIYRASGILSGKTREAHRMSKRLMTAFGLVVTSNVVHRQFSDLLWGRRQGIIAIPPTTGDIDPIPIETDRLRDLSDCFDFLQGSPLIEEPSRTLTGNAIGAHARKAWRPFSLPIANLERVRAQGDYLKQFWNAILVVAARIRDVRDEPETVVQANLESEIISAPPLPAGAAVPLPVPQRVIELDDEGYPIHCSDIPDWVAKQFPTQIAIMPRARKALNKAGHAEPGRIGRGIAALAGARRSLLLGDRDQLNSFEQQLLSMRMRDSFTNAERLRGQTGDAYVIHFEGRRLLLDRHLCSNSSGFNDPRLIRIYYAYDRTTQKIVIGWMPTHLPTSIS